MKKYRFFLHYNKIVSKQRGEHYWSVHFRKKCHFVKDIQCTVPTESKTNYTQPYVVMRGFASKVEIKNDKAIIL